VFRVYFNLMAQTSIDFPVVKSADLTETQSIRA